MRRILISSERTFSQGELEFAAGKGDLLNLELRVSPDIQSGPHQCALYLHNVDLVRLDSNPECGVLRDYY